jgi:hypothetical protein
LLRLQQLAALQVNAAEDDRLAAEIAIFYIAVNAQKQWTIALFGIYFLKIMAS